MLGNVFVLDGRFEEVVSSEESEVFAVGAFARYGARYFCLEAFTVLFHAAGLSACTALLDYIKVVTLLCFPSSKGSSFCSC